MYTHMARILGTRYHDGADFPKTWMENTNVIVIATTSGYLTVHIQGNIQRLTFKCDREKSYQPTDRCGENRGNLRKLVQVYPCVKKTGLIH